MKYHVLDEHNKSIVTIQISGSIQEDGKVNITISAETECEADITVYHKGNPIQTGGGKSYVTSSLTLTKNPDT